MPRLTNLSLSMILLLVFVPGRVDAYLIDLERGFDSLTDLVAAGAKSLRENACPETVPKSKLCVAAMAAEDIAGDLADPAPCGAAGQGTCMPILDHSRYVEIGGPCEPHLIEFRHVVCVAPWAADEAVPAAESIIRLTVAFATAYRSFTAQDMGSVINLVAAIKARDAQEVGQIIRDTEKFKKAFDLMNGLGMDTATVGVGQGGFAIAGIGVEVGAAIDREDTSLLQFYRTRVTSYGIQAGAGADLIFGAWVPSNCDIAGSVTGRILQVDAGPGAAGAIWYDDRGVFVGTTVAVGLLGAGGGMAKMIATTELLESTCEAEAKGPFDITPPPVSAREPRQITVAAGDTLWALSEAELGDPFRYREIFDANQPPLKTPDLIHPGQLLTLPERAE